MKKTYFIKILLMNIFIGLAIYIALISLVANILYAIFPSTEQDYKDSIYKELKTDFKINTLYRDIDDEELLNELKLILCTMANIDELQGAYNYGYIIDADTHDIVEDSSMGEFVREDKYAICRTNPSFIDVNGEEIKRYVVNTKNTGYDRYKYLPGGEQLGLDGYSFGTKFFYGEDLLKFQMEYKNILKEDIDDFNSSYGYASDIISMLLKPCITYEFYDKIKSASGKEYIIFYYSYNDLDYKSVYMQTESGALEKCYIKDTKMKKPEYNESVYVHPIMVKDIFSKFMLIMLVIIVFIVFINSIIKYVMKKSSYDKEQYRNALMDAMAHDLKSPLMSMSGYAENLKENVHTEKRDYYVDSILENIKYMNKIINDDLEISRMDYMNLDIKKEKVNLISIFNELIDHYKDEISEKNLTVNIDGEFVVNADERMMKIVIENLVTNFIYYSSDNGSVNITGQGKELAVANTTDVTFKGNLKRLLDPFVKEDSSRSGRKGTGLGLSIVSRVLDRHKLKYKLKYDKSDKIFSFIIRK